MFGNQIKGGFGLAVIIAVIVWILAFAALFVSPTEIGQSLRQSWGNFRGGEFTSDSSAGRPDASDEEEESPSPDDTEDDSPEPESPEGVPHVPSINPDSTPYPSLSPADQPGDTPSQPVDAPSQPGDSPNQPGVLLPGETSPSRSTPSEAPGGDDDDDNENSPDLKPLHDPDGAPMKTPSPDDPPTKEKMHVLDIPGWFTIFIPGEKPTARGKNPVQPGSFTPPKPDGPGPDKKD